MKAIALLCSLFLIFSLSFAHYEDEFDEFEDVAELEAMMDPHLLEEDEFEEAEPEKPEIKIKKIEGEEAVQEVHVDNYYKEMAFISFFVLYLLNYIYGASKNKTMATRWAKETNDMFHDQFTSVGEKNAVLTRESQHTYRMICTGRINCIGLQANLRLNRRYDILAFLYSFYNPTSDLVDIQVAMNDTSMESFVFALAYTIEGRTIMKEMKDVNALAKPTKIEKLSELFVVFSESRDIAHTLLRDSVKDILNKNRELIRFIHFTDQSQYLPNKYKKVLHFVYALPKTDEDYEKMKLLIKLVFYFIDSVKDVKLTPKQKEAAIAKRYDMDKEQRKQAMEERQEQLQKKKYEEATPEQLEKYKKKEKKKRLNARVKMIK